MDAVWIYITTKDAEQARAIGDMLVTRRLAACANVFPAIESIYEWKGELCRETESVLIVKSVKSMADDIIAAVKAAHTYECPCIVAMPVVAGSADYLDWIKQQTSPAAP